MNKNYYEKAIGLLRANNYITEYDAEEINTVFNGNFTVTRDSLFVMNIDFNKIESHSAEEIYQSVKKLNKFLMNDTDKRYHCHLQGIILFPKEQKAIFCYSRKVILCDISQISIYMNSFNNVMEKRYLTYHGWRQSSSCAFNYGILKLLKITKFIADNKTIEGYEPYCEFEKIIINTKAECKSRYEWKRSH